MIDFGDVNDIFAGGERQANIGLDLIIVRPQIRKHFDEARLDELAKSIQQNGLMVSLTVREVDNGFELVDGERRYRACKKIGMDSVPVLIKQYASDEEARRAQFIANVHRENFTQFEIAQELQHDLERLGSVEAVCAEKNISRSWFSKHITLLNLGESTAQFVEAGGSADLELINQLNVIEKVAPEKAQAVIEDLLTNPAKDGADSARKRVKKAKDEVKPPKDTVGKEGKVKKAQGEVGSVIGDVATAPDSSFMNPSVPIIVGLNDVDDSAEAILNLAYTRVMNGESQGDVLGSLSPQQVDRIKDFLHIFYVGGKDNVNGIKSAIKGLRIGNLGTDGYKVFCLIAHLLAVQQSEFSLDNVFNNLIG